jgi:hypothetical protein
MDNDTCSGHLFSLGFTGNRAMNPNANISRQNHWHDYTVMVQEKNDDFVECVYV